MAPDIITVQQAWIGWGKNAKNCVNLYYTSM
jgi:hypothetical protein